MEKVVYVLGAGFSAPMGLPVISNFRFKSQDMYLEDPVKYAHFKEVFDAIGEMSVSKNYYQTDLFNIEEILSILEMNDYLQGERLKPVFIQYIKDVLDYYTPEMTEYTGPVDNSWPNHLFGTHPTWNMYGPFIASLLNLVYERKPFPASMGLNEYKVGVVFNSQPPSLYGVVTLNYDLIPETIWRYSKKHCVTEVDDAFSSSPDGEAFAVGQPVKIAKLHGSLDGDVIVPPTWSKGIQTKIMPAWSVAQKLLSEATQIRVIGFSLPIGDAYVKYLMKAAAIQNRYLKRFDVICMDPGGSTRRRYDDFIQFSSYRFADANTTDYLDQNINSTYGERKKRREHDRQDNNPYFISLEAAHEAFMQRHNAS